MTRYPIEEFDWPPQTDLVSIFGTFRPLAQDVDFGDVKDNNCKYICLTNHFTLGTLNIQSSLRHLGQLLFLGGFPLEETSKALLLKAYMKHTYERKTLNLRTCFVSVGEFSWWPAVKCYNLGQLICFVKHYSDAQKEDRNCARRQFSLCDAVGKNIVSKHWLQWVQRQHLLKLVFQCSSSFTLCPLYFDRYGPCMLLCMQAHRRCTFVCLYLWKELRFQSGGGVKKTTLTVVSGILWTNFQKVSGEAQELAHDHPWPCCNRRRTPRQSHL